MWARIEERDIPTKWDVVEFINFDPADKYHSTLIFKPVSEWLQPYIDYDYWWDENIENFTTTQGYAPAGKKAQEAKRMEFQAAFAEIDARQSRSDRGIILALVDGAFPQEDSPNLTPYEQQRINDVGILWELEEIAQVNRDMQAELLALEITEDMTLEQAQEITLRIANARPWLPWAE